MPYQSQAQMRYMHAKQPGVAKRWDKEYPTPKSLPERKSEAYGRAASREEGR